MDLIEDVVPAVSCLVVVLALPLNLVAIYILCACIKRKSSTTVLMINLAVADVLFVCCLFFIIPYYFKGNVWVFGLFLCHFIYTIFFTTTYVSILSVMALSVDRYFAILYPIKSKVWRNKVWGCMASAITWVMAFIHVVPMNATKMMNINTDHNTSEASSCCDNFAPDDLEFIARLRLVLCITLYVFPLFVTSYCYASIMKVLLSNNVLNMGQEKKTRAIRLIIITMLIYLFCFGCYNATHVIGYVNHLNLWWRPLSLVFNTLNCMLDPLIYYFASTTCQEVLKEYFTKRTQSSNGNEATLAT
ncbi:proteinase-activated receptor 1-like [Petromyzon marinus]|uniref:Proteinase-activated receptor 1-like n=1 Tax=Petromyzon marinus TaxID=7757 RepID=A0AAJ7SQL7_PETMA|nr:proteinase-activated receptor 1-like [Petromyzon marinus]XP_032803727.1 proteinase-activated receptor 1-like [Petromyzon marinus]